MKITKIQKMRSGKYKIELDHHNTITTYDEVILKNNLLFKQELDSDVVNQIAKDTGAFDGYYKAVKYITTKMRSEKEMHEYLDKHEIPALEQENIMHKLKANGLINDYQFAASFVSDKVHLSNMGPYQIRRELESHNIDTNTIDKQLSLYEDSIFEEKLRKMMKKKIATDHKHSKYQLQQKLVQDFINLGYDKNQILNVLNEMNMSDDEAFEKEYQSLYHKLSKKYQGNELYIHLKTKLYQKGFSISDIQHKIEEDANGSED